MDQLTFVSHGKVISYRSAGVGPTVLLIHGGDPGVGPGGLLWSRNIDELAAAGFRVLAPDRPGFGWSDGLEDPAQHDVDFFVDGLEDLLDQVGGGRLHGLVGQSRGALLATMLWMRRPADVEKVVFANTNSLAPAYGATSKAAQGNPEHSRRQRLEALMVGHRGLGEQWWAEDAAIGRRDEIVSTLAAHRLARADYLDKLGTRKLQAIEWLRTTPLSQPVLLTWGIGDPMTTIADAAEVFGMVDHGTNDVSMQVINRCGHFPFLEYPSWFTDHAKNFLTETSDRSV